MRDLIVMLGSLSLLPLPFMYPVIGVYIWTWFSLMNPHRMAYTYAADIPYNKIIAVITGLGLLMARHERIVIPKGKLFFLLVIFFVWTLVSTIFAEWPEYSLGYYSAHILPLSIYLICFLLLIHDRLRIYVTLMVYCIALGWHAFKTAIVTILSAGYIGNFRNFGPPGTMIEDRNHFALVMVMLIPIAIYLYRHSLHQVVKYMWLGIAACAFIAVLGSFSRGGFITLVTMLIAFIMFMPFGIRIRSLIIGSLLLAVSLLFMPDTFHQRLTYMPDLFSFYKNRWDEKSVDDLSFRQRTMVWGMVRKMVESSPLIGKGPRAVQHPETAYIYYDTEHVLYGTEFYRSRAAHSVYFEVLGDSGWIGLLLFLAIAIVMMWSLRKVRKQTKDREDMLWAFDLAMTLQVSAVSYFVGGALLSVAYLDAYFILICITIVLVRIVNDRQNILIYSNNKY